MASEKQVNKATGEIETNKGTRYSVPFGIRVDGFVDRGTNHSDPIVKVYARQKGYKQVGDSEFDVVPVERVVVTETYNVTDRANSYKDDSDVYGILDKVLQTGDITALNQKIAQAPITDVSNMPKDLIDAQKVAAAGKAAYNNLDDAFTRGASMQYIAENFSEKEINAYIAGLKQKEAEKVSKENVNNE